MTGAQKQPNKIWLLIQLVLLLLSSVASRAAEVQYPAGSWQRLDPAEKRHWSAEKLNAAREYAKSIQSSAYMVIFGGRVLDEWGETSTRFKVHSVRKSFLCALYGIHVQKGHIKLSATLQELGIDDNEPSLTPIETTATVQDLLKARSGIYHVAHAETLQMKARRPARGSHRPGTHWYYNNWDFNALGTIFEQKAQAPIFAEFKKRIAEPLGMENFRINDGSYVSGKISNHRAYHFWMTARDMARFGLLYLRQGMWNRRQIIPLDWVKESTTPYSDVGGRGGYGYMWWVAAHGKHFPSVKLPDGSFSARGNGGQYILIIPQFDMVIVHQRNTEIRHERIGGREFGGLVKRILDARIVS